MKIKVFINKVIHLFEILRVKENSKVLYLTFDDGPEPSITEYVLEQLKLYEFKATFFCKGANAEKYPNLFELLKKNGHGIGNHTYNHINAFNVSSELYISDVFKADAILNTHLFRPPWGCLTLMSFVKLFTKFKIVHWSLDSRDSKRKNFDLHRNFDHLIKHTRPGEVVLFHACRCHEKETRQILPLYLEWLSKNGFKCEVLK